MEKNTSESYVVDEDLPNYQNLDINAIFNSCTYNHIYFTFKTQFASETFFSYISNVAADFLTKI
jgi:hypothetical protein